VRFQITIGHHSPTGREFSDFDLHYGVSEDLSVGGPHLIIRRYAIR
jgi:hypothetical protein